MTDAAVAIPAPTRAGADKRETILAAALRLIARLGLHNTPMSAVAREAGVAAGTLYLYFPSKEAMINALYLDVLRNVFETVGARARAIADGPGSAPHKLDSWIATIVEEAAARPWFPPIMLREIASGATHLDPDTFAMMNSVYGAVRDIVLQGQREDAFRDADPLLPHLSIMPPVLIVFARQRVVASAKVTKGLAEPRGVEDFVRHMQASARGMLRKD